MSDIKDDYLKFRVEEDESSGSMFNTIIKLLVILLLLILLVVLGVVAYKYLNSDANSQSISTTYLQPVTGQVAVQPTKQEQVTQAVGAQVAASGGVKKEDIALIVQSVLAQMKADKATKQPLSSNQQVVNDDNNDQELLSNLSSAQMDTLDEQNVNISNINNANYQQEIDNQNSKKVDNFNKVIIEKNAEVSQDDLSKLYNQLNTIMKKDKKKTKTSKYTKMISKEVKTRENAMRIITVKSGDSLSKLAFKAYGETSMFYKIFEANPDIVKDPDKIYIGQRLRVPR